MKKRYAADLENNLTRQQVSILKYLLDHVIATELALDHIMPTEKDFYIEMGQLRYRNLIICMGLIALNPKINSEPYLRVYSITELGVLTVSDIVPKNHRAVKCASVIKNARGSLPLPRKA